jgi:hypothetical protein
LGSLLKNNEGKLSNDAMYQVMLEKYAKASFAKIKEQKTRDKLEIDKRDKQMHMEKTHVLALKPHLRCQ